MKKSKNNSKKKKIKVRGIKIKLEEKPNTNSVESKQEETGLEEQIEESEIIEDKEFHHFLVSDKTPPPILPKVESREASLEEDVASAPTPQTQPEENIMNYSQRDYLSSNYGANNRNYEGTANPLLERTRTATSEHISRGELLDWKAQSQIRENTAITTEREKIQMRNIEARHDELPFEKRERKYR